nr:MAG TPA: hypothetical protein [Caudoviricetes sp.]
MSEFVAILLIIGIISLIYNSLQKKANRLK